MAPSTQLQRVTAAIKAMKRLGFRQDVAKLVLKELLKVYGNNWEYIEAENYRLLADAILDSQESKDPEPFQKDAAVTDELMKPVKRLRHIEDPCPSQSTVEPEAYGETLLKKKKIVADEGTSVNLSREINNAAEAQCSYAGRSASLSPDPLLKNGTAGIGEMAPQHAINFEDSSPLLHRKIPKLSRHTLHSSYQKDGYLCDRAEKAVCFKEPKIEVDTEVLQGTAVVSTSTIPDNPMDATSNDISTNNNVPIAVVAANGIPSGIADEAGKVGCSGENGSYGLTHASNIQLAPNEGNGAESFQVPAQNELANVQKRITIASSNMGKSAADLDAESGGPQEDVLKLSPLKESSKSSQLAGIHRRLTRKSFNGSPNLVSLETRRTSMNVLQSSLPVDAESNGIHENCAPNMPPLHENAVIATSPRHDKHDIAKGEERMIISVINEFNSENTPPYFHYIPWNAVYQNAHVNFSLAQIGEGDCCINCFGNCLSVSIPCPCMRETGGEFVYTLDGLLKKEFLNECISMNCYMDKRHVYCKNCPIGRFMGEDEHVACMGHLVRNFIKECWSKCGCNKQCGNRVVQRGITRNLQVFYTADGKGWGLRTLEELPRGAFVCEYVGEILTSKELYDRTVQGYGRAKNTYTLILDADWGSEEGLKDEEALCLDATFYGNVGRFINHRCFDANLVEVPVQWETPDHHYYHLAYFTTRKVEAFEELTWDYGINFKDHANPIKAFKCLCGSRFCRDTCRSKASIRGSRSK